MEAVEAPCIGDKVRALFLKDLPDSLVRQLGMFAASGRGDALVQKPGVQFLVALDPDPGREEPLADRADLALHLTFLPTRSRGAGDWIDQIMAGHLQEPTVVEAFLADKDGLHRCLHVVVDPASAGALEEGESPVVGIEHHLLRLARIGPHEEHPAVTQANMGYFDGSRRPIDHDNLVAPVELIGFTGRKAQGHEGGRSA